MTVNKNGIHIEQCEGCRGIFLDRGELEQIAGAESSYYGGYRGGHNDSPKPFRGGHADSPRGYRGGHPDSPRGYRGGHADSPRGYRGGHPDSPKGYRGHSDSPRPYGHDKRRKRGFLENLFD